MFDKAMLVALAKTLPISTRASILSEVYEANYEATVAKYESQISDHVPQHERHRQAVEKYEAEYEAAKADFLG
jgi:multidrug resistance efflux pump